MDHVTSPRTARSPGLPLVVRPPSRLPALWRWPGQTPGQTPAQEARCFAEGKRLLSAPISARMVAAAVSWMPMAQTQEAPYSAHPLSCKREYEMSRRQLVPGHHPGYAEKNIQDFSASTRVYCQGRRWTSAWLRWCDASQEGTDA